MSMKLQYATKYGLNADYRTIKGSDLDNATLNAGNEVTVWSEKVPAGKLRFWGYGPRARDLGAEAFAFAEILADGSGTGSDGDEISGDLILAVVDPVQEDVIARRTFGDLGTLADAANDARTERPVLSETNVKASQDRYLELRIKADSSSDGAVVASDSNVLLYRGEVNSSR